MAEPYVYEPFLWMDDIIELDENNQPIPLKDDEGNIIYEKGPYGNLILHPITREPLPKYKRSQNGTRHSAKRENHQEQGIVIAHKRLDDFDNWRIKKDIRDEINDKAPGSAGSFVDSFDEDPIRITREVARAVLTAPRAAETTVLNVDNTDGFKAFTEVTVYDAVNSEDVLITDVTASTITVQPLQHDYVKGAVIARSNVSIGNSQMKIGTWGTYSVAVSEVV